MKREPLVALVLCGAASAQIPYDHLVYANRTTSATVPAIGIVDPVFGTATPLVPISGSLAQHGSRAVAIDPLAPGVLYSITSVSTSIAAAVPVLTLTGNRFVRTNLTVNLGAPGVPVHVRWAPGHGLLLMGRGGQVNRMFLRNMATGIVTSQPTPTLLPNFATDMVFLGGKAYALSEGDGTAAAVSTIVEWDLVANTDRVVGTNYPPLFAMAASAGLLLVGDATGGLHLIDPVTGSMTPYLATGLGKLTSIAVAASGLVYVVAESPGTWAIHNVLVGGPPLYTSAVAVDDLVVGPTAVATMLSFGAGCSGSTNLAPTLGFSGAPALGTTSGVTLANALAYAPAILIFGSSRVADPLGPLPRDLGILGMPGCNQYTDLGGSLAALADAAGTAQLQFALPANPVFAGARVPLQWACLDAAANALGVTVSSGGEWYVQ